MLNPQELVKALSDQAQATSKMTENLRDLLTSFELFRRSQIWSPINSADKVKDLVAYKGACYVRSITAYNGGLSTWYLQTHNMFNPAPDGYKTFLPPMPIAPGIPQFYDMGSEGALFSNGLYVCGSTTDVTKTLILTNDIFFFVLLRPA